LVQVLPHILDAARIASDDQRNDVVRQVACDGELASVQRRVAEAGHAVLGDELERDEIPSRAADDDPGVDDSHYGAAFLDTSASSPAPASASTRPHTRFTLMPSERR